MISLLFELPTLGLALALEIAGLHAEAREQLGRRWPPRPPGAKVAGTLSFEATTELVGLPSGALVMAEVSFREATVAEVVTNAAELSLDLGDGRIEGRGRVDVRHARGGIEAAVRAATVLALAQRGVFVLHAAVVRRGGDALVLLGASSAGKTTTARRLGREGLQRIADDMIAIDLEARPPTLHLLPFERAGQTSLFAAKAAGPVLCRGGAIVRKGAPCAGLSAVEDAPRAWAEALIMLPPLPGTEPLVLFRFARLCEVPLRALDAPASGPLAPVVLPWLMQLVERRAGSMKSLDVPRRAAHPETRASAMGEVHEMARVTRAPNVAWRVLDGTAVLVVPSSPSVQTLNPVGTAVWELADGRSIGAIVDAIVNDFEVERTQAALDVKRFVRELESKQMLIVEESGR